MKSFRKELFNASYYTPACRPDVSGGRYSDVYEYDVNSNMTKDRNKGIEITYNYLNLPTKVTWLDVNENATSKQYLKYLYGTV